MTGRPQTLAITLAPLTMLGLVASLGAGAAHAQFSGGHTEPAPFGGPALAQDRVLSRAIGSLEVTAPGLVNNVIPLANTGYGKSTSFPVAWSPVPGAKSYALAMEELDPGEQRATLYWLAYNIPADTTSLPRNIHNKQVVTGAKAMMQGRNSWDGIGYVGPKPPVGDEPHHFHIQVFALSKMLPIGGGAGLDAVVNAMNDKVIAEGDLVVSFTAPKPDDPNAPPKTRGAKPAA